MTRHDPAGSSEFELTIEGRLGPVMRWSLRPCRVVDTHTCTTIRGVPDTDVAALVGLLDAHGLRIEGVWVATATSGAERR